jgi:hypothetical protein
MNRLLINLAVIIISACVSVAQTPANYHYNQFNYMGGNGPCNVQLEYCRTGNLAPFQTCGIQNSAWYASHGTPEVFLMKKMAVFGLQFGLGSIELNQNMEKVFSLPAMNLNKEKTILYHFV